METIVKTPEPRANPRMPAFESWREIVQSGGDVAQIEAFALEHLIDLHRARARSAGEGR